MSSKFGWRVLPEAVIWFSSYRRWIVGLAETWGPSYMNDVSKKRFSSIGNKNETTHIQPTPFQMG